MLHGVTTGAYYPPVVTTWKIITTSQMTTGTLCSGTHAYIYIARWLKRQHMMSVVGMIWTVHTPQTFTTARAPELAKGIRVKAGTDNMFKLFIQVFVVIGANNLS